MLIVAAGGPTRHSRRRRSTACGPKWRSGPRGRGRRRRCGGRAQEASVATEAEPADEPLAGCDVPGHSRDQRRLRPRRREDRHVAGHDDKIERSPEFELAEVRPYPLDVRCQPLRRREHRVINVGPDHLDPMPGQLDGHSSRATPGVQNGRRRVRPDEGRLPVHVLPRGGQPVELGLVVVTLPLGGAHYLPAPSLRSRFATRSNAALYHCAVVRHVHSAKTTRECCPLSTLNRLHRSRGGSTSFPAVSAAQTRFDGYRGHKRPDVDPHPRTPGNGCEANHPRTPGWAAGRRRCGCWASALPIEEFAEDAGPTARVIDFGEDAEEVVGVLAAGAVAGDPSLGGDEDPVLVVAEGRTA